MNKWDTQIHRQKEEWWLPGAGERGTGSDNWMGMELQLYKMKVVFEMDTSDGSTTVWMDLITTELYTLKWSRW